jgi:glycosyltransferase involved in cell wall biosynthesis
MLKISVITAVHNNRETISAALDSALGQSGVDIELVVIDGGSTDGTLEVLRSYADRLHVLVSEPDRGIYDALNKGIQRASGEVVGFLHSDDMFADAGVLSRIAAAFADPGVGAVYGDLLYVRKDNPDQVVRYWRSGEFSGRRLGWGWMPPHPTLYIRRHVYEQHGLFDTSFRIAADYDFILRTLGQNRVGVCYIPEVLVKMRVGGASNRSLSNIMRKSSEDLRALRRNGVGGLGALLWKNLSKLPQFLGR